MAPSADFGPDVSEERLVAAVRAGNAAAFESLFRLYHATMLRFAASFLNERDAAEDVVQEVLTWVWANRAEWTPTPEVRTYLLAAVRNRALNVLRNARTRADAQQALSRTAPLGPDSELEANEAREVVWNAISELSENRRTVLVLRWRHGLEWEEVAAVMGINVSAARMHHSRALRDLREKIPGLG